MAQTCGMKAQDGVLVCVMRHDGVVINVKRWIDMIRSRWIVASRGKEERDPSTMQRWQYSGSTVDTDTTHKHSAILGSPWP